MALGSSLTTSVPTVGTTVHTLNKASDGKYHDLTITNSNGDVIPVSLTLKASPITGSFRTFHLVLKHRPAMFDGVLGASQGQVTVAATVTAKIGEDISTSDILAFAQYMGSLLTQSAIVSALRDGSYE